jgi:hypothetical protein
MEAMLPLIKSSQSFELIVTKELENKIRFLCEKLPTKEYSGTLFYKTYGSFENKSLIVEAVDFYLQDIGVSTFTQFKNDVNLAGYMVDHDLMDCFTGLMHSHNKMATFFSGTDINTLQSEGNDANHFVSLIVNNEGKYTAAITRKITNIAEGDYQTEYRTFGDNLISSKGEHYKTTNSAIEYSDLTIRVYEASGEPETELEERFDELLKDANSFLNASRKSEFETKDGKKSNYAGISQYNPFVGDWSLFEDIPEIPDNNFINDNGSNIRISSNIINSHVAQIITGNLFANYKRDLDLKSWIKNMEVVYDRRFKNNFDAFKTFADSFIEFLNFELPEIVYHGVVVDFVERDCAWAEQLSYTLENMCKYKRNKYLDYYIESLKVWTLV